ncbi:MAG: WD40 repeat domain-containing protein, partial [Cyanobacteria bacterium J06621_11]
SDSSRRTVKTWDAKTGSCLSTLEIPDGGDRDRFSTLKFFICSPTEEQIATVNEGTSIQLWNLKTSCCDFELNASRNVLYFGYHSAAYSPDGKKIAVAYSGRVALWNAETGELICIIGSFDDDDELKHENSVLLLIYSPNGEQIATIFENETVNFWSTSTGTYLKGLGRSTMNAFLAVYSPDGKQIAVLETDNTLRLWSTDTGELMYEVAALTSRIQHIVYTPDAKRIIISTINSIIRVWDIESNEYILTVDERICAGLNITGTKGLNPGQRAALKLMGATDHNEEGER